jgi:hypothetical protein
MVGVCSVPPGAGVAVALSRPVPSVVDVAVVVAGAGVAVAGAVGSDVTGAVGGLAGAMFVHTTAGGAQPSQLLEVLVSVRVIILVVLGRSGGHRGRHHRRSLLHAHHAPLGAADSAIGTVPVLNTAISNLRPVPLLTIALATVIFAPQGILGWFDQLWARYVGGGPREQGPAPLVVVMRRYRRKIRQLSVFGDEER